MKKHISLYRRFKFSVPFSIKESLNESANDEFIIHGVAINETTTRNGTKFIAEELAKSASSLRNKPLLKDHNNSVDSIVGKTTDNVNYNSDSRAIDFEAVVLDPEMRDKIKQGLINSVSVGATVKDFTNEKNEDGKPTGAVIVSGIDFVELSLVAIPADPNAGFAKAIAESMALVEAYEPNSNKKEEIEMSEEKTKLEELKLEREKLEQELELMKIEKLKIEKEELVAEKTVVEDKTEGTLAENKTVESVEDDSFIIEQSEYGGIALSVDYDKMDSLHRLRRE